MRAFHQADNQSAAQLEQLLPDVETVAELIHEDWREKRRAAGVTSMKCEDGSEWMDPWSELTETAKEKTRSMVRSVYEAIAIAKSE